mmetsp:Transcript_21482/g.33431  ORF Transcript_21482/g.33431 Transcript_21482/m.33431 type:complete len:463 (+) Transcript_21482:73-1461(+)
MQQIVVLLLLGLLNPFSGHRLKPQAAKLIAKAKSHDQGPVVCSCLGPEEVSIQALNFTRRFEFGSSRGKRSNEEWSGTGAFVNQSLFEIRLPGLASRWVSQQEKCLGPDRPATLSGSSGGFSFSMSRSSGGFGSAKRQEEFGGAASAFLNFIHGGLKKISTGEEDKRTPSGQREVPQPALFTYALKIDKNGGDGKLVMAEEGDHATDKSVPHLAKYDGRDLTKHSYLAKGGNLLFAGQIFVDLGEEWGHSAWEWRDIEEKSVSALFPNAVIVIDDGSGSYTPPEINLPTVACILQSYFPGLKVSANHYLETPKTPGARRMQLDFDIGNVVKGRQKGGFKTKELPYRFPYALRYMVTPSSDIGHIDLRHSTFPSRWGTIASGEVSADGAAFSVVSDIGVIKGVSEGRAIDWVLDGEAFDTWVYPEWSGLTNPSIQNQRLRVEATDEFVETKFTTIFADTTFKS